MRWRWILLCVAALFGTGYVYDAVASQQSTVIGYQTGCVSTANALRAALPQNKAAFDKFQRTCSILAADHDAGLVPPPPPPSATPTPTPPKPALNPQTYNKGSNGQDARYCVTHDDGYRYDSGGREIDGRRSGKFVPGLRPADEMNGLEPCDPYLNFPPWPAGSYEV